MSGRRIVSGAESLMKTLAAIMAVALLIGGSLGVAYAQPTHVDLFPGPGATDASGSAKIGFDGTVMVGKVETKNLPPQPFGSGHFYGVWFVRADTGDKAFLGALINGKSIILSTGGTGRMEFSATQFTAGSNAGLPITLGSVGNNQIVVLIEDNINGLTPSPVGGLPAGVAAAGAF